MSFVLKTCIQINILFYKNQIDFSQENKGSRTNRNSLSPKNQIGTSVMWEDEKRQTPDSKLTLTSHALSVQTPQVNENCDQQQQPRKKKKKGKQINPPFPSLGWAVLFPPHPTHTGKLEGLAPDLGRASLPYQQACWSSFPWEPGLPGHTGLRHVEERGGWEAPQRSSESSLFSKLSPRRASLTPLCQTILQWNQVFDVMDWEGRINRVPQRDNQDDCPAFEIWWRAFLKPPIQKQVINGSRWSSYLWTRHIHQEAGRSRLLPASLPSLKFTLNGQIWVWEWTYVALISYFKLGCQ